MGWAIKREDGTYRYWSRWDKVGTLAAGETWEQLVTAPSVTPSLAQQDIDAVRDAYVTAKASITTLWQDATIPLKARTAVRDLGQCVEELLKALNRRIQ